MVGTNINPNFIDEEMGLGRLGNLSIIVQLVIDGAGLQTPVV